jgi:threonine/homoserine/homoserine lactone efflux protein
MALLFLGVVIMLVGFCNLIYAAGQSIDRRRAEALRQQRAQELHKARLKGIAANHQ